MKAFTLSTSITLAWTYSADAVSGYSTTWTPSASSCEKAVLHSASAVITTVTSTPRRASDSSAPSTDAESISSFSTTTVWVAEAMSPASWDSDPGLQTRSTPGAAGDGAAPD